MVDTDSFSQEVCDWSTLHWSIENDLEHDFRWKESAKVLHSLGLYKECLQCLETHENTASTLEPEACLLCSSWIASKKPEKAVAFAKRVLSVSPKAILSDSQKDNTETIVVKDLRFRQLCENGIEIYLDEENEMMNQTLQLLPVGSVFDPTANESVSLKEIADYRNFLTESFHDSRYCEVALLLEAHLLAGSTSPNTSESLIPLFFKSSSPASHDLLGAWIQNIIRSEDEVTTGHFYWSRPFASSLIKAAKNRRHMESFDYRRQIAFYSIPEIYNFLIKIDPLELKRHLLHPNPFPLNYQISINYNLDHLNDPLVKALKLWFKGIQRIKKGQSTYEIQQFISAALESYPGLFICWQHLAAIFVASNKISQGYKAFLVASKLIGNEENALHDFCQFMIDQGTVNTKFSFFDNELELVCSHSIDHEQIYPQSGWLEHNPLELYENSLKMMEYCLHDLKDKTYSIKGLGVVNQRETLIVWEKKTGVPLMNAIVWLDTRTNAIVHRILSEYGGTEAFRETTGLPIASYFTGVKLLWLLETKPQIASLLRNKEALIGTVDTWLIWNLTGGVEGGVYVTDLTNASRTLLMDIHTLSWSTEMLRVFGPGLTKSSLPQIVANAEVVGYINKTKFDELNGVPISGVAGDQQAACIGHGMLDSGEVKATFGTGASVLMVTGGGLPVMAKSGLLTTPCFQFSKRGPVVYALEGSVAIAGAALTWLKENLGALDTPDEAEELLKKVTDTGDVYFVPAFAGLFAPRWRADARGCIVGLTQHTTKAHIVRALIESIGFQMREILEAFKKDSLVIPSYRESHELKVDGGLCKVIPSSLQAVADITGIPVRMRKNVEVTSVGAAILAAIGCGLIDKDIISKQNVCKDEDDVIWCPSLEENDRQYKIERWEMAVQRSLNWDGISGPMDSAAAAAAANQRLYHDRILSIDSTNDTTLTPARLLSIDSSGSFSNDF